MYCLRICPPPCQEIGPALSGPSCRYLWTPDGHWLRPRCLAVDNGMGRQHCCCHSGIHVGWRSVRAVREGAVDRHAVGGRQLEQSCFRDRDLLQDVGCCSKLASRTNQKTLCLHRRWRYARFTIDHRGLIIHVYHRECRHRVKCSVCACDR